MKNILTFLALIVAPISAADRQAAAPEPREIEVAWPLWSDISVSLYDGAEWLGVRPATARVPARLVLMDAAKRELAAIFLEESPTFVPDVRATPAECWEAAQSALGALGVPVAGDGADWFRALLCALGPRARVSVSLPQGWRLREVAARVVGTDSWARPPEHVAVPSRNRPAVWLLPIGAGRAYIPWYLAGDGSTRFAFRATRNGSADLFLTAVADVNDQVGMLTVSRVRPEWW
jgi:hypothetical protein